MVTAPPKSSKSAALQRGVTLVELMISITIASLMGYAFTKVQSYILRFTLVSKAKQETVQESRTALTIIQKLIQQGTASTFVIDQQSGQPPYSRLYFQSTDLNNVTREFYFYQIGRSLYMDYRSLGDPAWKSKIISKNLRFITFFYPETNDNTLLSVTLTVSKRTAEQKETFLQLAIQNVRILNT